MAPAPAACLTPCSSKLHPNIAGLGGGPAIVAGHRSRVAPSGVRVENRALEAPPWRLRGLSVYLPMAPGRFPARHDDAAYVVDLIHDPGALYEAGSAKQQDARRIGRAGRAAAQKLCGGSFGGRVRCGPEPSAESLKRSRGQVRHMFGLSLECSPAMPPAQMYTAWVSR